MKVGDRVEILYPVYFGETGVVTVLLKRFNEPAMLTVRLAKGTNFICDETLVKELEDYE